MGFFINSMCCCIHNEKSDRNDAPQRPRMGLDPQAVRKGDGFQPSLGKSTISTMVFATIEMGVSCKTVPSKKKLKPSQKERP